MITEKANIVGVLHSELSTHVNDDRKIKGIFYLNNNNNGLGLLPIRRMK